MSVMQYELDEAVKDLRVEADKSGYGRWINDSMLKTYGWIALNAGARARAAHVVANAVPPPPPHDPPSAPLEKDL